MKGFSAFLDRRCKDARIMKSVPENISLSKDLFYQFPWSTESFPLHPEFLSGSAEGQKLQQHVCRLRCFSRVWLCVTPWTVARQAPLSMGFSRQYYWSGLPWPPPGDLPHPGIKPMSLMSMCIGKWVLYPSSHVGRPQTDGKCPCCCWSVTGKCSCKVSICSWHDLQCFRYTTKWFTCTLYV